MSSPTTSSPVKNFAAVAALLVWFSLALQLYVAIQNRIAGIPETIVRFFSYYTVETNLLIALCFTMIYKQGITQKGNFFTRANTLTATAVYICIVALTYNVILRFQWAPTGLARVPDELLHLIIPIIYLIFWIRFVPRQNLQWKNILPWSIFPLLYLVYSLLRGAQVAWYPYPFLDVAKLGYNRVLFNSAIVCIVFIVFAGLFIGLSKMTNKKMQVE